MKMTIAISIIRRRPWMSESLPNKRRRHGVGQQIRRHHPAQVLDVAQHAAHGRQRRRDDGLLQRREEHRQHDAHHDGVDRRVVERRGRRAGPSNSSGVSLRVSSIFAASFIGARTMTNAGGNSTTGSNSYEFAKDKPISLVDGPNLISMLQRHGRAYKLDLVEARRLNAEPAILHPRWMLRRPGFHLDAPPHEVFFATSPSRPSATSAASSRCDPPDPYPSHRPRSRRPCPAPTRPPHAHVPGSPDTSGCHQYKSLPAATSL